MHAINLAVALGYVLKRAKAEAPAKYQLARMKARGRVIGKRCGTSQNIGIKVRKAKTDIARKAKTAIKEVPANKRTIPISLPESGTPEDAKENLAKSVPGWDKLTSHEQTELAEMATAQLRARKPVKVTLTGMPGGRKSIGIAGDCETQGLLSCKRHSPW